MGYVLQAPSRPFPTPPPYRWAPPSPTRAPAPHNSNLRPPQKPGGPVSQSRPTRKALPPRFWRLLGLDKPNQVVSQSRGRGLVLLLSLVAIVARHLDLRLGVSEHLA